MKSSVEPLEGNKVKVYVEVEEDEFEHDIDRAFKEIAKEVRLPGFRQGRIPRKVLEARVGIGPAREQALRDAVPQYLAKAVREHDVDLIATPEVEITDGQEEGPVEFDATCEIRPTVDVPGYGGLRVELPNIDVSDDDVATAREAEVVRHASLNTVDRPAALGDFVTIDLTGTRDGEEVSGLNAEEWSYEVGQGWIADDFDERLVGLSAGDEVSFTTTPKGLDDPVDLEVSVEAVQERVLPDVTDEWVVDTLGEYDTIEEWEAALRSNLVEERLQQARQQIVPGVSTALAGLVDIDVPEAMVDTALNRQMQSTVQRFAAQGIDLQQWLEATGQAPEQFVESMREPSEQAVRVDLALRAVADAEALEVAGDELDREYARLAMQYQQKAKDIRKAYETNDAVPELINQIRTSKAMDWLVDHADYVDPAGQPIDRDTLLVPDEQDPSDDDIADSDDNNSDLNDSDTPQPAEDSDR